MSAAASALPSRLEATSAQLVMERVANTGLIERGAVAVISVAAIRERAADRWERKRDAVWAYANRKLAEHLDSVDIHARLNETDFLLATTGDNEAAVHGVALRVLEEVLTFFVGSAEMPDIKIQTVTAFGEGGLTCAAVDPRTISRKPRPKSSPPEIVAYDKPTVDPAEEAKRNPFSFTDSEGRRMRIDFAVEQVISLKHRVTAAIRIEPTVSMPGSGEVVPSRRFAGLSATDVHTIDRATFDYGSLFLPKAGSKTQPALVLPASFRTLAGRKGRDSLIIAAGGAADRLKPNVMIEMVDIDRGTPGSRLMEVTGLVTSLCRGVFIRLHPAKDMTAAVRGYRFSGLTLDATELGDTDSQIAQHLLAFGEQAKTLGALTVAQGLRNEGFFQVAGVAGITHASIRGAPVTIHAGK